MGAILSCFNWPENRPAGHIILIEPPSALLGVFTIPINAKHLYKALSKEGSGSLVFIMMPVIGSPCSSSLRGFMTEKAPCPTYQLRPPAFAPVILVGHFLISSETASDEMIFS